MLPSKWYAKQTLFTAEHAIESCSGKNLLGNSFGPKCNQNKYCKISEIVEKEFFSHDVKWNMISDHDLELI